MESLRMTVAEVFEQIRREDVGERARRQPPRESFEVAPVRGKRVGSQRAAEPHLVQVLIDQRVVSHGQFSALGDRVGINDR